MPRKTVLATGVFDLLHIGHLRFLEESKKTGGPHSKLVVVVARDKTVRRRKGKGPIVPEDQRRELVAALRVVDRAILGREEIDLLGILKEVKPDIVCVGYDQDAIRAAVTRLVRKEELPVRVVRIRRFGPIGFNSSSKLKSRIAKAVSAS
ncbi:FAD synthase [Candidatus Bathyarchaeota archaeon]|nr:MAG: FAD synthase [Candidatus Bathyarchaeota archaeon]TMI33909.1 MAG: FAD synthase [Candidatus Bathyarchaeota archaeon]TMI51228.1 MAG: FAD synthase [Candidatus Bathyarchaeota archaeon]